MTLAGAWVQVGTAWKRRGRADRTSGEAPPQAVAYPANANVINAKNHGVVGDGIADDTAAINTLLNTYDWIGSNADPQTHAGVHRAAPFTIYFPEGTYRLTGPVTVTGSTIRILGAGVTRTVWKLDSNLAAYQTGTNYLLRTGEALQLGQENAGFANYVEHLTLDVGAGNPAAVGFRNSVANSGSARHLLLRSSDPAKVGKYGMMFGTTAGPGWVADVTIDGFDYGIAGEGSLVNDIGFSGVTIKNPKVAALLPGNKAWTFEDLTVQNAPMVADLTDARSTVLVAGGSFTGPGTNAFRTVAGAYLWLRGITATGFTQLVQQAGVNRFVGATAVTEWASVNYRRGNTSTAWTESNALVSRNLPSTRGPDYNNYNFAEWKCPQDFGYTGGNVGPALQQAVDSGAKVVYLPYGDYSLTTSVTIGSSSAVQRIDFLFSRVTGSSSAGITVGNTTQPFVVLENVAPSTLTFTHNSPAAVVVRNVGNINAYSRALVATGPNATGNLFLESAGANVRVEVNRPISFWGRQTNRERGEHVISGGATARIFADNVELQPTDVDSDAKFTGCTVEVIGGAFDVQQDYAAYPASGKAAYAVTDGTLSIVMPSALRGTGTSVGRWVSDIRAGVSVGDVLAADAHHATTGLTDDRVVVGLYVSPP